ncbi:hypothetical protein RB2150_11406 [Rhodobacteraceae bacterium HTCC2150]|nr:hypothetical protein RB2150_11406 [Rhodobacteraceae bacterium HTCC2150]
MSNELYRGFIEQTAWALQTHTISNVTFGKAETSISINHRTASEHTPAGWHVTDFGGRDSLFLSENADIAEIGRLVVNAHSLAQESSPNKSALPAFDDAMA